MLASLCANNRMKICANDNIKKSYRRTEPLLEHTEAQIISRVAADGVERMNICQAGVARTPSTLPDGDDAK